MEGRLGVMKKRLDLYTKIVVYCNNNIGDRNV